MDRALVLPTLYSLIVRKIVLLSWNAKGIGYEDDGIEQLKSYLSATATPLGVFANSTDPDEWKFYENLGTNQFRTITRPQFESAVLKTGLMRILNKCLRRFLLGKNQTMKFPIDHLRRLLAPLITDRTLLTMEEYKLCKIKV